eukprot:TRINITY_DN10225_c0_g1_i1.p1 TRINITY_DN10225_c0_g1~~TRINITY_DN10225_c0_g1_i1.p1  ORF type:complete len:377 (+),score=20.02 TRINITY_DN10225_c0_g1_i1:77-1132(+)
MTSHQIASSLCLDPDFEIRPLTKYPDQNSYTIETKVEILVNQLESDPALFLERYGSMLSIDQLAFFDGLPRNASITHLLKKFRAEKGPVGGKQSRNRRLRKLQELTSNSDFFSEQSMQERDPHLFHLYVGQYLSPEEKQAQRQQNGIQTLSQTLLRCYDLQRAAERNPQAQDPVRTETDHEDVEFQTGSLRSHLRRSQQHDDLICSDESELESEDDLDDDDEDSIRQKRTRYRPSRGPPSPRDPEPRPALFGEFDRNGSDSANQMDDTELKDERPHRIRELEESAEDWRLRPLEDREEGKQRLRERFTQIMQERFLRGEDEDFIDYSKIDNEPLYDDLRIIQQDAEDQYFR